LKGIDQKKDQSYVLYRLGQDVLSRTIFPLGDIKKEEVRRIAKDLKLNVAEKEESQEICFIPDGNYGKFLMDYFPEAIHPGPILDKEGNILGMHGGIVFYTVGQRKGIGAYGERKYVVSIDKEKNALIVGGLDEIFGEELLAEDVSFVYPESLDGEIEVTAKIRYNCPEAEALLKSASDGMWQVSFKKPQKSITPGQSVVFYKGEEVIGGGIICKKT
jgi:tRNA-specific 2-thiouridylase